MMLVRPFETENKQAGNKNKAAGIAVTVIVHALLILLLYFLVMTPPDPPYTDNAGGMAVNYGTSDVGSGDQQAFTPVPVTVAKPEEIKQAAQPDASTAQENLETQDKEDAVVIPTKVEVKKTKVKPIPDATYKPAVKPAAAPVEPKPKVDKDALFTPGAPGKANHSKGDGEGKGKGDQGDPNGDNSKNYHGGGTGDHPGTGGTGTGFNPDSGPPGLGNVRLAGRKIKAKPKFSYDCEAKGKVVVAIKVNKNGRVIGADFTQAGSTTGDDCLINRAKQLALQYTFDDNAAAAETQNGTITFIFKAD